MQECVCIFRIFRVFMNKPMLCLTVVVVSFAISFFSITVHFFYYNSCCYCCSLDGITPEARCHFRLQASMQRGGHLCQLIYDTHRKCQHLLPFSHTLRVYYNSLALAYQVKLMQNKNNLRASHTRNQLNSQI